MDEEKQTEPAPASDPAAECSKWFGGGVSVIAALKGTIPEPIHNLSWGVDIPKSVMSSLRDGNTAILHDANGNPYAVLLMDFFGTIREKRVEPPNDRTEPQPDGSSDLLSGARRDANDVVWLPVKFDGMVEARQLGTNTRLREFTAEEWQWLPRAT